MTRKKFGDLYAEVLRDGRINYYVLLRQSAPGGHYWWAARMPGSETTSHHIIKGWFKPSSSHYRKMSGE